MISLSQEFCEPIFLGNTCQLFSSLSKHDVQILEIYLPPSSKEGPRLFQAVSRLCLGLLTFLSPGRGITKVAEVSNSQDETCTEAPHLTVLKDL